MAKLTSKALLNKAGMQQEASSKAMFGRKQEKKHFTYIWLISSY
jgi:hypothetical protein